MPQRVKLFLFLAFIGCSSFGSAETDCMVLFKAAFEKMKALAPKQGMGLSLKYDVRVQTADGSSYTDQVDLSILDKRAKIVSTDATIYQDEKAMIVIRPESSTIFVTRPTDETLHKLKFQNVTRLQDSLFSKMVLRTCISDNLPTQGSLKKMTFDLPKNVQVRVGLTSVIYWVDDRAITIKKVQLNYALREGQPLKMLVIEFKEIDTTRSKLPFEGSALSKVYDGRNTLRPMYKDYSVVDKR